MAYTTIDDPSAYFQATTWSAESSGDVTVTFGGNSNLQLDFLWSKCRNVGHSHALANTSVAPSGNYYYLLTDTTGAEDTGTDDLKSITSDGFTAGQDAHFGLSARTYVGFAWKANGGTRTTFTESGANPGGGYQANTTSGFSIIDYTGTGSAGTVAHGLGVVPNVFMTKSRSDSSTNWIIYHHKMTSNPENNYIQFNTSAYGTHSSAWNNTAPTSSVITLGNSDEVCKDSSNFIMYAFAEKQGYSKFGKYTGNGAEPGGPFVYLGFKPAWLMITASSESGQAWFLNDNQRDPTNEITKRVFPNLDSPEGEASGDNNLDYLSNGFRITTQDDGMNKSGVEYIYFAFAESPFVSSEGVPTTAR
jgi:hypothetical protein